MFEKTDSDLAKSQLDNLQMKSNGCYSDSAFWFALNQPLKHLKSSLFIEGNLSSQRANSLSKHHPWPPVNLLYKCSTLVKWLINLEYQFSYDHWHQATLSSASTFFSILLTHEGWHREAYRDFQPSLTSSSDGAKGFSDNRFRAPPAYTAQLPTLHQHRANNQYRTANQI